MKINLRYALLAGAAVLVAALVMRWCQGRVLPAPEAIQIALDDAVAGIENNDLDRVMRHVSDEFRGSAGGEEVGRQGLKQRLFILARRGVGVEILAQDVEVFEEEAMVTVVVALWRGGVKGAASGNATAREIELDFRLEGRAWKVIRSRQRVARIEDFL